MQLISIWRRNTDMMHDWVEKEREIHRKKEGKDNVVPNDLHAKNRRSSGNDKLEVLKMCVYLRFFLVSSEGIESRAKSRTRQTNTQRETDERWNSLTHSQSETLMRTIHKVRLPRLHLHPNTFFSLVYRYLCSLLFHSLIRFSIFYARTGIDYVSVYWRVSSPLSLLLIPFERRTLVLTVCAMRRRGLLSRFQSRFQTFFKQEARYITVAWERHFIIKEVAKKNHFFYQHSANSVAQNNHNSYRHRTRERWLKKIIRGGSVTFNASNKSALKIAQPQTIFFDSLSYPLFRHYVYMTLTKQISFSVFFP